ncbi:hypothetical protein CEXT_783841 [Caerostris extrusa]|uniref:Uncharacterized protein n=1 Tax=Caerostris extrusa TaxID=172846 RepID=A0AAV4NW29_CAEEX|nr:hypothetical protein CEXT_783841 [Caerostris extrusa]
MDKSGYWFTRLFVTEKKLLEALTFSISTQDKRIPHQEIVSTINSGKFAWQSPCPRDLVPPKSKLPNPIRHCCNPAAITESNSTEVEELSIPNCKTFYDEIEKPLNIQTYSISPDRKYVLMSHDHEQVFKHSFTAKYKVYIVESE